MSRITLSYRNVRKRTGAWRDPMVFTLAMLTVVILLACSVRIFVGHG